MGSPTQRRKSYQRFFAWTFVLAAMLAIVLFALEIALPPEPLPRHVPSTSAVSALSDFGQHDLQLLAVASALAIALAALIGLVVSMLQAWAEPKQEGSSSGDAPAPMSHGGHARISQRIGAQTPTVPKARRPSTAAWPPIEPGAYPPAPRKINQPSAKHQSRTTDGR
jgi:hypothetical protein